MSLVRVGPGTALFSRTSDGHGPCRGTRRDPAPWSPVPPVGALPPAPRPALPTERRARIPLRPPAVRRASPYLCAVDAVDAVGSMKRVSRPLRISQPCVPCAAGPAPASSLAVCAQRALEEDARCGSRAPLRCPRGCPPRRWCRRPPPSGPMSMTQSAVLITSRLCSMTMTVLPLSTSRSRTPSSLGMSSKCRPVVGSSST